MAWILGIAIGTLALVLIGVAIFVKEYIESRNRPVVYWDRDKNSDDFRDGVAWWVLPDTNRPADEHFGEFDISRGLYQAILSLDILYALEKLPHEFILSTYEEGILIGSGVTDAAKSYARRHRHLHKRAMIGILVKKFHQKEKNIGSK